MGKTSTVQPADESPFLGKKRILLLLLLFLLLGSALWFGDSTLQEAPPPVSSVEPFVPMDFRPFPPAEESSEGKKEAPAFALTEAPPPKPLPPPPPPPVVQTPAPTAPLPGSRRPGPYAEFSFLFVFHPQAILGEDANDPEARKALQKAIEAVSKTYTPLVLIDADSLTLNEMTQNKTSTVVYHEPSCDLTEKIRGVFTQLHPPKSATPASGN